MTNKNLLKALSFIDPELIIKASPDSKAAAVKRRMRINLKYVACAASILLVFAIVLSVLPHISVPEIFLPSDGSSLPESRLELVTPDAYTPLWYSTSGSEKDTVNDRYSGESFDNVKVYTKKNMPDRSADIFGSEETLSYHSSESAEYLSYDVDRYTYKKGSDLIYACYRAGTDKLIYYSTPPKHSTGQSSASEFDSEDSLIEYVKGILLEYSGVATGKWKIRISTHTDEFESVEGFVNYPDAEEKYTVTFYKEIGGIERSDSMFVTLTSFGEIIELSAANSDSYFGRFESINIDKEKLISVTNAAFDAAFDADAFEITDITLCSDGQKLWAKLIIDHTGGESDGSVSYVIKLAELKKAPSDKNDPPIGSIDSDTDRFEESDYGNPTVESEEMPETESETVMETELRTESTQPPQEETTEEESNLATEYTEGLEFVSRADGSYAVKAGKSFSATEVIIPTEYMGKPVVEILDSGFKSKIAIKNVNLPSSLIRIGESAFEGCVSIESLTVPEGVTHIGAYAFMDCTKLKTLILPDSLMSVGGSIARGTKNFIKYLSAPSIAIHQIRVDNLTELHVTSGYSIYGLANASKLKTVTLADSINFIEGYAFQNCTALEEITLPDNVQYIEVCAFQGCSNLNRISVPTTITHIAADAFLGCDMLEYKKYRNGYYLGSDDAPCAALVKPIDDSVSDFELHPDTKIIVTNAFKGCNIASINIPDGVKIIGESAFESCLSLTEVYIPASVTEIKYTAFKDCPALETINFGGTVEQWWNIDKGVNWDEYTDFYTVICTNGNLTK